MTIFKRQTRSLIITSPPTREEREQLDAGATDVGVEQGRITVGALNTLQYGRYEAALRKVAPWVEAKCGKPWREAVLDDSAGPDVEGALRWARVHAAVVSAETRTINRTTDAATEWQPVEWPELDDLGAFVQETPGDLAAALDELVFDLNPGLFRQGLQTTEDAKKNGGISAG